MDLYDEKRLRAILSQLPVGMNIKLEFTSYDEDKEKDKLRTEQQNKYYHKLLDIICAHTGEEHMQVHTDLKCMFLSRPWVKGNKEYTLVKSTTELTSKDFGDYLEKVFQWASSELGLILPSSSEYY